MLTNNPYDINKTNEIEKSFASLVYSNMLSKRFGIRSCKTIVGKNRIKVDYELMKLSKQLEDDCAPKPIKKPCLLDIPPCCKCDDFENKK